MEIMIFCGIYLVELICYLTVLRMLFDVQVRLRVWMTVGILMPVVVSRLSVKDDVKNLLVTIGVIVITIISIEGIIGEKGVKLTLTFLLLESVNGTFVRFCEMSSFFDMNKRRSIAYLVVKGCTAMSIFLIYMLKERMGRYKKAHISSAIYLSMGTVIASMMFCLAFLNQVIGYLNTSTYDILCNILSIAIFIRVLFLIIFVIYIKVTHDKMEQLLKTERLLKESQVNYYKQVLKKEIDTRKYRHDMMNHLVYIRDVLDKRKLDDAKRYLDGILGGFKKIQNTYFVTGNEMVDTIMNYFFGMLSKETRIFIKGKCPVEIDMDDTEICTIFSNIFQNVVEEIKGNNAFNAEIILEIQRGKRYVEYNIKNTLFNTIDKKLIDKNGFPKSRKSDKREHGIGMTNVKRAIERVSGKFDWKEEGGYFCVKIVLPIK